MYHDDPMTNYLCSRPTMSDCYDEPYIGWCLSCGGLAPEVSTPIGLRSACCHGVVLEHDPLCKQCGELDEYTEDGICTDCQEAEDEQD